MKYAMTDIHGEYQGMELLLEHARVDFSKDQIVFCGDMINRGQESGKVLKRIKSLTEQYPNHVHALIGNHEEMMRAYIQSGDPLWLMHGGRETLKDLERTFSKTERDEHVEWASSLPLVYQDEQFVYTHAGLNIGEPLEQQSREILWMSESDFYRIPREHLLAFTHNKPVVHGHTPVERIYFDGARLGCDSGANTYSIQEQRGLSLVNLDEMTYDVYHQYTKKIESRQFSRY